ncbi:MAG: cytochrome c biogenesis protein CcsA [Candidatus Methanoperedens sp.]|nr:cytochrome c biogenesis protein CcsA [Candidatus Methanoperedens sp.]
MGFPEYLAARESLALIGQPVITYILILSLFQAAFSVLYLLKKEKYYSYFIKCMYINAGLYVLGFIFLIRYHIQIYNTVLIEYPEFMRQMVPVDSSRFIIPLWIESEKLYFWAMAAFIFALAAQKRKEIASFTGIILSGFSIIVYFLSNPFKEPLPVVHSEITRWYSALGQGDATIFQLAGTLYGRITYYYNSTYMWVHPPMLFIAYASLIITFAACIYMLIEQDRAYDEIAYRFAKSGYILLTAGMLIGYPWAVEAWKDSAWWWDPKISGSIMMWVLYSAYLHAHIYVARGKMWNATACLGIICFVSLVFTYLLTYIVPGIHSVVQP